MSLPVLAAIVVLFFIGLIQDALNVLYLILVRDNRYFLAAILNVVILAISYGLVAAFISQGLDKSLSNLTSFSLGGGMGTFFILRRQSKIKKSEP